MAAGRRLRNADELVKPALQQTIKALDPPESDAALVRLAEVTAAAIDDMQLEVKAAMIGQTAPLLLKLLQELDERARRRRAVQSGPPSRLQLLREARAASDASRRHR